MAGVFRFSFGPWNIHEGADPFGPPVRESVAFEHKLECYRQLGFEGVPFHDDDAIPGFRPAGGRPGKNQEERRRFQKSRGDKAARHVLRRRLVGDTT